MDQKPPFLYDVSERQLFVLTTVGDRARFLIQLLTTFLRSADQLWMLEDFLTQVGTLIGNAISTFEFNWSHGHLGASIYVFIIPHELTLTSQFQCFITRW